MAGRVYSKRDGSIATVILENEGRLNALSLPMWRQLGAEFQALDADTDLRCVVLRGAGGAFAAGADIAEFENERHDVNSAKIYGKAVHEALDAILSCRHPVIALIDGACVGGGLEIAARCDLRICGASARFGIPVNRLGAVVAYQEMLPLIRIAGPAAVLELLLEGKIIDAMQAERSRIVNRVVADAELEKDVYTTAMRIAEGAPLVARWHKKFVRRLLDPSPLSAAELEENYACFATEDFQTGFRAFLEKTKPVFKGR